MLDTGHVIAFALGGVSGFMLALLVWKVGINSACNELRKQEEERERRDPANWWKYGGNPYNADDDDRRGGLA